MRNTEQEYRERPVTRYSPKTLQEPASFTRSHLLKFPELPKITVPALNSIVEPSERIPHPQSITYMPDHGFSEGFSA